MKLFIKLNTYSKNMQNKSNMEIYVLIGILFQIALPSLVLLCKSISNIKQKNYFLVIMNHAKILLYNRGNTSKLMSSSYDQHFSLLFELTEIAIFIFSLV